MASSATYSILLLLFLSLTAVFCDMKLLQMAHNQVVQARTWVESHHHHDVNFASSMVTRSSSSSSLAVALKDCAKLYEESEHRLNQLISEPGEEDNDNDDDGMRVITWVSGVMTNHRTCLDGLQEKGYYKDVEAEGGLQKNLTLSLKEALQLFVKNKQHRVKAKAKAKSKCVL